MNRRRRSWAGVLGLWCALATLAGAADLDLRWVVYQDKLGRSRALLDDVSDTYLFPVTMISRRREADNRATVMAIYAKASEIVAARRPSLPFQ